jgi:hypothetical protein
MAKWLNASVLDNGLNNIKTNATRMLLIKNYTAGDSYATVFGNRLAEATMINADFTLSNGAANSRTLTTPAAGTKTATATASSTGGDNLHFAFTDGSSTVYWVTDETTDQPITSGNTVSFPQLSLNSAQPV